MVILRSLVSFHLLDQCFPGFFDLLLPFFPGHILTAPPNICLHLKRFFHTDNMLSACCSVQLLDPYFRYSTIYCLHFFSACVAADIFYSGPSEMMFHQRQILFRPELCIPWWLLIRGSLCLIEAFVPANFRSFGLSKENITAPVCCCFFPFPLVLPFCHLH